MKLRILNDHLRLRLERAEVDAIGEGRPVHGCTRFPDGSMFGYRLETGVAEVCARFDSGTMVIGLPDSTARTWASDDTQVSIRGALPLPDGILQVLVEKDFECLVPREGEGQDNRFPNPKKRR
jgi:hypothetical protein